MAVRGLKLQLSSFHKGLCFQIDVQRKHCGGCPVTGRCSYSLQEYLLSSNILLGFVLQFMCLWVCKCTMYSCTNEQLNSSGILVEAQPYTAGGGLSLPPVYTYFSHCLLAFYIYPVSLAGCSLHSWGKTSFPRHIHWLQYPENRFHWHGPSLAQSPAVWSPSWRSCQTEKMTFPEDSVFAGGQKGFTGSKSKAEIKLSTGCQWGLAQESSARTPEPLGQVQCGHS